MLYVVLDFTNLGLNINIMNSNRLIGLCVMHCCLNTSKTAVLGVIGADVMFARLVDFLLANFDPCKEPSNEYSIHFNWFLKLLGFFV